MGDRGRVVMSVCFVFVFCILAAPLSAETNETMELEEVVVQALPIIEGNVVDDFGALTTVISQEQMEALNAQDLGTALRKTPGVSISRYNPIGSFGGGEGGGVFIRGMGSSRPGAEIKTLYPAQFADIDLAERANDIYAFLVGNPVYEQMAEDYGPLGAKAPFLQEAGR